MYAPLLVAWLVVCMLIVYIAPFSYCFVVDVALRFEEPHTLLEFDDYDHGKCERREMR